MYSRVQFVFKNKQKQTNNSEYKMQQKMKQQTNFEQTDCTFVQEKFLSSNFNTIRSDLF